MTAYFDSGVLIKLYVHEPNSASAAAAVSRFARVPFNPLHELEIRNTFRLLEGRGSITPAQRAASEHLFETDIIADRLRRTVPDWQRVFQHAAALSAQHAAATLARSLDILHVAAATAAGLPRFFTADQRQARLAEAHGLDVHLIA